MYHLLLVAKGYCLMVQLMVENLMEITKVMCTVIQSLQYVQKPFFCSHTDETHESLFHYDRYQTG